MFALVFTQNSEFVDNNIQTCRFELDREVIRVIRGRDKNKSYLAATVVI